MTRYRTFFKFPPSCHLLILFLFPLLLVLSFLSVFVAQEVSRHLPQVKLLRQRAKPAACYGEELLPSKVTLITWWQRCCTGKDGDYKAPEPDLQQLPVVDEHVHRVLCSDRCPVVRFVAVQEKLLPLPACKLVCLNGSEWSHKVQHNRRHFEQLPIRDVVHSGLFL